MGRNFIRKTQFENKLWRTSEGQLLVLPTNMDYRNIIYFGTGWFLKNIYAIGSDCVTITLLLCRLLNYEDFKVNTIKMPSVFSGFFQA